MKEMLKFRAVLGLASVAAAISTVQAGCSTTEQMSNSKGGASGTDGDATAAGEGGFDSGVEHNASSARGGADDAAGQNAGGSTNSPEGIPGESGNSGAAGLGNEGSPITVEGTVVDASLQAVAGAIVRIGSTTSKTDGSGRFSFAGVSTPYAVAVTSSKQALIYEGLTRQDPRLQVLTFGADYAADIKATLNGGVGFPDPANHFHTCAFSGSDAFAQTNADSGDGSCSLRAHFSKQDTAGTLIALQFKGANAVAPTVFTGIGTLPLGLHNGVAQSDAAIKLSDKVATDRLGGTVLVPDGYPAAKVQAFLAFDADTSVLTSRTEPVNGAFALSVPRWAGTTMTVSAFTTGPGLVGGSWTVVTGLSSQESAADLRLHALPEMVQPPESATGVQRSDSFIWSASDLAVYRLDIVVGDYYYSVITSATHASIGALLGPQSAWPADATSRWQLSGFSFQSVDDAAGLDGYYRNFRRISNSTPRAPRSSMRAFVTGLSHFTSGSN